METVVAHVQPVFPAQTVEVRADSARARTLAKLVGRTSERSFCFSERKGIVCGENNLDQVVHHEQQMISNEGDRFVLTSSLPMVTFLIVKVPHDSLRFCILRKSFSAS